MELAIDTSTRIATVAVSSQGELIAELTWHSGQNHTAEIFPHLVYLLRQAGVEIGDISGVVVAKGPGSFNGLRVGMSVAKGLAFSLDVPLVGVSTLEVEAFPHAAAGLPVCPLQNAGRGEIAAALFQTRGGVWRRLLEEHITTLEGLLPRIRVRTLFCGWVPEEVSFRLREVLGGKALLVGGAPSVRRAGQLAELGWRRLEVGDVDHSPTLQPLYLRRPAITISRRWPLAVQSG